MFSIKSDISADDKEILQVLYDTMIEENNLKSILSIKANAIIDIEPQKYYTPPPVVMADILGRRRRHNFDDFVNEFSLYQAEEEPIGNITYMFSDLRPGESKWLSPYMLLIAEEEETHMDYTVLSESSGSKKSGTIVAIKEK